MRAVLCGLVVAFAGFTLACGGVGKKGTAPGGNAAVVSEHGGGKGGASLVNALVDFEALSEWCEQANKEIAIETEANSVRGEELQQAKLAEIKNALEGKRFQWRIQVMEITKDALRLAAYHYRTEKSPHSPVPNEVIFLTVSVQQSKGASHNADWKIDSRFVLGGVSPERVRQVNKGDFVTVTGEVETVAASGPLFAVKTRGSRLAQ